MRFGTRLPSGRVNGRHPVDGIGRAGQGGRLDNEGCVGVFLATAHPAKFGEIVEPIIRRPIVTPAPLADALARPRHILRIDASIDAVTEALGA